MPASEILRAASKVKQHPRDYLLTRLNLLGSHSKLAHELRIPPVAIGFAMAQYNIVQIRKYEVSGTTYKATPIWVKREELLFRNEWREF